MPKKRTKKQSLYNEYFDLHAFYSNKYGDKTVVLEQVGSFHETYDVDGEGPDLNKLSNVSNLTKTKKNKKVPVSIKNPYMVGFPTVALAKYLDILMRHGYTAVVIDQVSLPPNPKREVTGIFSPGTYLDNAFSPDSNDIVNLYIEDMIQRNGNYLMCIGMAAIDLSTGENTIHEAYSTSEDDKLALDEASRFLHSFNAKEIVVYRNTIDEGMKCKGVMSNLDVIRYLEIENKAYQLKDTFKTQLDRDCLNVNVQNEFLGKIFGKNGMMTPLEYIDMENKPFATISYMLLLNFAYEHNEKIINHIDRPDIFECDKYLILGNNAASQLNVLSDNQNDVGTQFNSLFDVVNMTCTAMGRRFLKQNLVSPILNTTKLQIRYDCIEEFMNNPELAKDLDNRLHGILDIQRMLRKISIGSLHPFQFVSFIDSLKEVVEIFNLASSTKIFKKMLPNKKITTNLNKLIKESDDRFKYDIMEKYKITDVAESLFTTGRNEDIDNIQKEITNINHKMDVLSMDLSRLVSDVGKAKFKKGNDRKVRIDNNSVDGYYLKLTKLRAKSLFKKLKELEVNRDETLSDNQVSVVLGDFDDVITFKAQSKGDTKLKCDTLRDWSNKLLVFTSAINDLVRNRYLVILNEIFDTYNIPLKQVINFVSLLDFLLSGSKVATKYNYVKPKIDKDDKKGFVDAKDIRHPIVERIRQDVEYKPHSIQLGKRGSNDLDGILLFGLNSSGKSTLMKAIGLSIIMAQTGMFVPAKKFIYSPYTSLYTRIAANDNQQKGLSSFTLEMTELRAILRRNAPRTLIIGDEVCKGTEHLSGTSIVAATLITLAKSGSSFIFATHIHELADMERIKKLKNVKCYHLTVDYDDQKDQLVFDRILKEGSGPSLYGITVARYIVRDDKFMKLVQEIKNEICNVPNELITTKKSKYNAKVLMYECNVCHFKEKANERGTFDTHHINFQSNCQDGFVTDKPHLQMNSQSNLVVLCKRCHKMVHDDQILIHGYKDTSNGSSLDYEYVENVNVKVMKKKKYSQKEVMKVLGYKGKSLASARRQIKKDHNLNISTKLIKQMWAGEY